MIWACLDEFAAIKTIRRVGMKLRSFAIGLGTLGLAVGLACTPVEISGYLVSVDGKTALATPGNGNGNGKDLFCYSFLSILSQAPNKRGGKRDVQLSPRSLAKRTLNWAVAHNLLKDMFAGSLVSQDRLLERHFSDAKGYAALYRDSGSRAHFYNERLRLVHECLASTRGGKVLDVGCGPGVLLNSLAGGRFELFGVDRSPEMIRAAKVLTAGQTLNLSVGRLEQLPWPDDFFDVILALGVLEYLPQLDAGLIEIARVARPGAVIVVSMLNPQSLYRSIYRPLFALRSLLLGSRVEPRPALWLYRQKALMRMMDACQLETVDVLYFDVNVCVPPFGSRYPDQAATLNRWLEHHFGKRLRRLLHTGFLIKARKK